MGFFKPNVNYYLASPTFQVSWVIGGTLSDFYAGYGSNGYYIQAATVHADRADFFTWRFLFSGVLAYPRTYMISRYLFWCLRIDGVLYLPQYNPVNGFAYWSSGANYVYADSVQGGALQLVLYNKCGISPIEYQDRNLAYQGDEFYAASNEVYQTGLTAKNFVMQPRGSIRSTGTPKTVEILWPRWVCDASSGYGRYSPVDGETGYRYFGHQQYVSSDGQYTFIRRAFRAGESNIQAQINGWEFIETSGTLNKGPIHQYVIGIYDIGKRGDAEYYTGSQPSVSAAVTFRYVSYHGVSKPDIVLLFDKYVAYEETEDCLYGEVSRCY